MPIRRSTGERAGLGGKSRRARSARVRCGMPGDAAGNLSPRGTDVISTRLAAYLANRGIHYGWVVAGTTFLAMLATSGAMGAPGVMIAPLQHEFGWQNADISSAMAVRSLLFGLMGPFAAALMNRFGIKRVVTVALLLIAGGILGSFVMTQLWQLVLFWASSSGSAPA